MDLLATPRRRRWLFAALYFFEGAPMGFVFWALPAMLGRAGHAGSAIALLTARLVLPWAFKFVWAPLVDQLRGPRWTERGWIVAAQLVMAASLVPLVVGDGVSGDLGLLSAALTVHALAAATQDVAIDALAVRSTSHDERGRLNGWMNGGMMVGRGVFTSSALWSVGRAGEVVVVGSLALVLAAGTGLALLYRPPSPPPPSRARARSWLRSLRAAVGRRTTWLALAFAATGGAAFEVVGGLLGPFVVERGGSDTALGWFYGVPAILCPLAGGLVIGPLADRRGHRFALRIAAAFVALAALAVALLAASGRPADLALYSLLAALYLGIGAFVASSYALFMDWTDPELGSTQFSAYMGATNLCESWTVAAAGLVLARAGYGAAFAGAALVTLAALALVPGGRGGAAARRG